MCMCGGVVTVFILKRGHKSSSCVLECFAYDIVHRDRQIILIHCVCGSHPSSGVTPRNEDTPGGSSVLASMHAYY